ncbi:MAG: glycosyltransferase family 2 protein [Patescibacteria group bacterium]
MKNLPLVSFCISTYKRPQFLKTAIEAILKQKYNNFEIVISEDDSEKTAEKVAESFKSKRIFYYKNKNHLGMTKSYNKAISLAKGEFITVLADDDPPTHDMLEVFTDALKQYPHAKAFFGGSYVNITSRNIEKVTKLPQGFHSLINKNQRYESLRLLKPKAFFRKFFKQEIFPHYQWTTALIAKDIVGKIKGVPDYDSAHFIDYAYLLKIANLTDFVIINKELGVFALHELSYGKKKDTLKEYEKGVVGFDKIISNLAKKFDCEKEYQKFLTDYVIMFLINRLRHYRVYKYKVDPKSLFKVYDDISKELTFFSKRATELYLKLNFHYIYDFISLIRENYGFVKLRIKNMTLK